jgi:cobyrinic acid a,c-diamide synthase
MDNLSQSNSYRCPALVITAPSSGSGKTTVVAALARFFTNQGKKVRVFKTGPDFIDPAFLAYASGHPVYQLDFWMCGEDHCKQLVAQAAAEADLILIEGVMGMFDGQCSSADIAVTLGIPVLAVIDAGAMAQTFGAIAYGLANFNSDIEMFGVLANRVGSAGHTEMLKESLPDTLTFYGALPKASGLTLPERHLGLVQAAELEDLDDRLNKAAELLSGSTNLVLPPSSIFTPMATPAVTPWLQGVKIAIARDKAFSFIYQANLELLATMGAELCFFSPLAYTVSDTLLTECDALYLPGGYPELYLDELASNKPLQVQISNHINSGKPALAECGGMLYLGRSLTNLQNQQRQLCGVLDNKAIMQNTLAALGLVEAEITPGQYLRGHTFHYSKTESDESVLCEPRSQRGKIMDPVWRKKNLIASYVHWYFPSNSTLIARLFLGKL